jgi:hypothetical protein
MKHKQPYVCSIGYTFVAEAAGLHLRDMFLEPEKVAEAYRRLPELLPPRLWAACGDSFRQPVLHGTNYDHLSTLGAIIDFPPDGEPKPRQLLQGPEDLDRLENPPSFREAGRLPERRRLWTRLREAWGEDLPPEPPRPGAEGPVTSAVLLAGPEFLTWPYDCPAAAHRLLEFCTRSAHALMMEVGWSFPLRIMWLCDDFAGMFSPALFTEFVVPYWNLWWELAGAEWRGVHTELLRPDHLPLLAECRVNQFDPGVDQHVTPRDLAERCPCDWQIPIRPWHMNADSPEAVLAEYRELATYEPKLIEFSLFELRQIDNFLAVLELAKEMAE